MDGSVITRVDARHQFTDRGSAIEATGDGEFESFMPEKLRPLLAGRTSFDVAGTLTSAGGVEIERASIESSAITGTASGSLDPEAASDFALSLEAKGEGVPLSFGTEDSPIDMVLRTASARALGDGREPNLDITATLAKVATNDAELTELAIALHSDAFNIQTRTGPVTGTATAAALIIDNPTIAPLVAGKISAGIAGTLATDTLTVTDGNLASDALDGKFTGDVSLADGSVTLKLNAALAAVGAAGLAAAGAGRAGATRRGHHARPRRAGVGRSVLDLVGRALRIRQGAHRQQRDRRRYHRQARRCRPAGAAAQAARSTSPSRRRARWRSPMFR